MTTVTKEIAKTEPKPIDTIRALLIKSKDQIAMALPKHMNADRMMRIAVTACQKTPKLLDCRPVSLLGAIIQCAQLGLEPNDGTGRAWLIPFGNEVTFIPGYRGLVDLARRSGEIKRFDVRAVHAGDVFQYSYGLKPLLNHIPKPAERGDLTHVYAVAEFKDGGLQFDVMTKEEVDKIRKRSKASSSGPWVTDYEEMAKKTVVRRICKMLPVSAETIQAVHLDERAELGLPQNLALLADPTEKALDDKGQVEGPMPQRKSEKKAEAPADDKPGQVAFNGKLLRIAKTTMGDKPVDVAVMDVAGAEVKIYTSIEAMGEALKPFIEKQITATVDVVAGKNFLVEFQPF